MDITVIVRQSFQADAGADKRDNLRSRFTGAEYGHS
jgi:hypothetical protein